jgi:hypothetical protein
MDSLAQQYFTPGVILINDDKEAGGQLGIKVLIRALLSKVPPYCNYVILYDQDYLWFRCKIEVFFNAIKKAEKGEADQILVHADARIADEELVVLSAGPSRDGRVGKTSSGH